MVKEWIAKIKKSDLGWAEGLSHDIILGLGYVFFRLFPHVQEIFQILWSCM